MARKIFLSLIPFYLFTLATQAAYLRIYRNQGDDLPDTQNLFNGF